MKYIRFNDDVLGEVFINLTEAIEGKEVLITEELSKNDIEKIQKMIDSKFKNDSSINKEITNAVKKELDSKATEDAIVTVVTNCLVQLFKALWGRRGFWKSAIENRPN